MLLQMAYARKDHSRKVQASNRTRSRQWMRCRIQLWVNLESLGVRMQGVGLDALLASQLASRMRMRVRPVVVRRRRRKRKKQR